MKTVMKFGIVLVVLALVTSMASASATLEWDEGAVELTAGSMDMDGGDLIIGGGGDDVEVILEDATITDIDDFLIEGSGQVDITLLGDAIIQSDDTMELGKNGTLNLTMDGYSELTIDRDGGGESIDIGEDAGSNATIVMSGDSLIRVIGHDDHDIELAQDGGTVSITMTDNATISVGGDDLKLAQDGGTAYLNVESGLVSVADSLKLDDENSAAIAKVTLGEQNNVAGDLYDETSYLAVVDASDLQLGASAELDVLLGGLMLLDDDVTAMIAQAIVDGEIYTTQTGLVYDAKKDIWVAAFVAWDYDITVAGRTAVYLVPEPATMILLGLGGLVLRRRKRA